MQQFFNKYSNYIIGGSILLFVVFFSVWIKYQKNNNTTNLIKQSYNFTGEKLKETIV